LLKVVGGEFELEYIKQMILNHK